MKLQEGAHLVVQKSFIMFVIIVEISIWGNTVLHAECRLEERGQIVQDAIQSSILMLAQTAGIQS